MLTGAVAAIDDVRAWAVPYREPNDHASTRYATLVRVRDVDGAVGWGEAATIAAGAARATVELCNSYAARLTGVAAEPDAAMAAMRADGWWYGGAGIDSFAVSAIDMALWNLRCLVEGTTLTARMERVTGKASRTLPVLLSMHATLADLDDAAASIAAAARSLGGIGAKIAFGKAGDADLGRDPVRDVRFVEALRRAGGDDFAIMIDIAPSLGWALGDVLARAAGFQDLGVAWLEEPLGDRDPEGYARLRMSTPLRLAYGEREWSVRGVTELLRDGNVDVVGMDPGRLQGVTGFLSAARRCNDAGVQANAHAFAGPLIAAAAAAASGVSEACRVFEVPEHRNDLHELIEGADGEVDEIAVGRRALG